MGPPRFLRTCYLADVKWLAAALFACRAPAPAPDASGLVGPSAAPAAVEAAGPLVRDLASARIVAVGDTMMHGMVQRSAADADELGEGGASTNHGGYDALWAAVSGRIAEADLAFTNLETPIAPKTGGGVRSMVFNAPPVVMDSLVAAGFDVVSAANNHSYDQGRKGLVETIEQYAARPALTSIGAGTTCAEAGRARIVKAGEIPIAWIGATDLYNTDLNGEAEEACVFTMDPTRVLAEAATARAAGAELVVVSVHWGVEYRTAPEAQHVALAHTLIEGGVDVVLGHHPHVLQPVELVEAADGRTGLVVYSMGNFVSNQSAWYKPGLHGVGAANPRDGLMVRFRVVRRAYGRGEAAVIRTELADLEAIPLWTTNNTHTRRGAEEVEIRVVATGDRIAELEAALAAATDPTAVVRLTKELTEMRRRWDQVSEIVGGGLLAPLEPPPGQGDEG
jgi:hypothetical protein